ncbi:MAG: M20 family metallopeptidase [Lewinellaceae bacterium]|nr:M20 family metallopeptidase [Lewinellaceae bacterium]MCB9291324.1 M20 family metallopeptidase [Lewinellaceae bacterium]
MEENVHKIRQYLREHRPEMEAFLRALAAIETPSHAPAAQEPLFDILAAKFRSLGYHIIRVPGRKTGGFLIARPTRRERCCPIQLLIGHCDTVWEKGTLQSMPVEQAGGQLKGPGIFDMKAGITQMVFALQAIHDIGLKMEATPVCLINSDEEIGSRESTPAIRRLARIAGRAFVLEPPLGPEGKLKTTRKGLGRFTLTVKGKAAHAGLDPGKGASAILELSHQIQHLFNLNEPEKGITVNVGMIEGGISPNVIAPVSKAIIDVRVPTHKDAARLSEAILSLQPATPGASLEIEGGFGRPPMEPTPRNRRLWQQARKAGVQMGLELQETSAGGGSDGNTASLYTATLDGLGTTGDGAHAAHEFIFLDKLEERALLLTLLLLLPSGRKKD